MKLQNLRMNKIPRGGCVMLPRGKLNLIYPNIYLTIFKFKGFI